MTNKIREGPLVRALLGNMLNSEGSDHDLHEGWERTERKNLTLAGGTAGNRVE